VRYRRHGPEFEGLLVLSLFVTVAHLEQYVCMELGR
jgi:hypothetical protein